MRREKKLLYIKDKKKEQAMIIIQINGWGEEHAMIMDEEREQAIKMAD